MAELTVRLAELDCVATRWIAGGIWYVLGFPLQVLYFQGVWGGRSGEDICSQLTNVDSAFWAQDDASMDTCRMLLDRKFGSFGTTVGVVAYFFALIWIVRCAVRKIGCGG